MTTLILALALASLSPVAQAQFKCVQPGGGVSFQQAPCPTGAAATRLVLPAPPPADPEQDAIRALMAQGREAYGMNRQQLDYVMGMAPSHINSTATPGGRREQLVYYQQHRSVYIYMVDGFVQSMQESGK